MKKRIVSWLLSVAIIVGLMPATVTALPPVVASAPAVESQVKRFMNQLPEVPVQAASSSLCSPPLSTMS